MQALELKIPPPVVALLLGVAMWLISLATPPVEIAGSGRIIAALAMAALGVAITISGAIALRRGGTTTNPLKPETASSVVAVGAYRFTRNPMYLGLAMLLVGWAVFLPSAWALAGPVIFVIYITRFQIVPEERALMARFGDAYAAYRTKVRRWL